MCDIQIVDSSVLAIIMPTDANSLAMQVVSKKKKASFLFVSVTFACLVLASLIVSIWCVLSIQKLADSYEHYGNVAPVSFAGSYEIPQDKVAVEDEMLKPISNASQTVFGFLRIQKTGSSALLSFLGLSSGLLSWDKYIYNASEYVHSERIPKTVFCVYGNAKGLTEDYFRRNPNDGENVFVIGPPSLSVVPDCQHFSYDSLVVHWERTRPYVNPPARNFSLQVFTIVRDPYERLRSVFYYVAERTRTNFWKEMFTDDQYERLCSFDIDGWLRLLHTHDGYRLNSTRKWRRIDLPYQFSMLNEDPNKAISMIQGETPQVLILLQECFEESLRFLEYKFNLDPGVVDNFTNHVMFDANTNYAARQNVSLNNVSHETTLRNRAKHWFYRDYMFYNASVEQFRYQIQSINLDPSILKNPCDLLWGNSSSDKSIFSDE